MKLRYDMNTLANVQALRRGTVAFCIVASVSDFIVVVFTKFNKSLQLHRSRRASEFLNCLTLLFVRVRLERRWVIVR